MLFPFSALAADVCVDKFPNAVNKSLSEFTEINKDAFRFTKSVTLKDDQKEFISLFEKVLSMHGGLTPPWPMNEFNVYEYTKGDSPAFGAISYSFNGCVYGYNVVDRKTFETLFGQDT